MRTKILMAVIVVSATLLSGCGITTKTTTTPASSGQPTTTDDGLTPLPSTTTTVPFDSKVLTVEEMPKGWTSAGGVDYQTVSGDQPSRCFYDLDQLDGGALDTTSAAFRLRAGPPFFTQVIFSFQPGASKPSVDTVVKALDGCGSFVVPSSTGNVVGAVVPARIKLTGLDDYRVYALGLKDATSQSAVLILLGRSGDNVMLATYAIDGAQPDAKSAAKLFQMAIDKLTTGKIDPNGHETA